MTLHICPRCNRRGVTESKNRRSGRYRCRYCGYYPGWLRPPENRK